MSTDSSYLKEQPSRKLRKANQIWFLASTDSRTLLVYTDRHGTPDMYRGRFADNTAQFTFQRRTLFIRDSPTIEHVDEDAGRLGCGWRAGVIAGIGRQRSADQET